MTAPSISTTGVGGSIYDALSSSVTAYSAQQSVAPFSSLLQQAQTPPPPTPVTAPQPPAPAPPQKPAHDSSATDTSASTTSQDPSASANDGSQAGATNSAANPSQDPAPSTQPASTGAASQDANGPSGQSVATSGHDHTTKTGTETNTTRATGSSAKADGEQQTTASDVTSVQTGGQTKLAIQPAKKGGQQQGDARGDGKSTDAKDGPSGSSEQAPSVVSIDPTAQASVPVVAATAGEKNPSGSAQATTTASGASSAGADVLKNSLTAANPSPTLPSGGAKQAQSSQPVPKAGSSANTAGAGTNAAGQPQWGVNGFASELTKASDAAALASQTITTTADPSAGNSSTALGQAVATVSTDAAQAVATVTTDGAKSADGPSTPSGGAAAASTAAGTPAGTSTANTPLTGRSNLETYAAGNSSQSAAGGGPNTVDRARFVQRVTRAFQAVGDQGGEIRLRLSPPELGSLQMQISVKDGGITAHIQADNSEAQQLLLASLPDLRDRLAQQDIHIEQFDVQLAGQSSGGMPQSPQGNPDFDQAGRRSMVGSNSPAPSAVTETAPAASGSVSLTSGALNVVV